MIRLRNFRQSNLTLPDFQKGYTLRSEIVWSYLDVEFMHFCFTVSDEEKLHALRRELGWSHLGNADRRTRRLERLTMLKAENVEERKALEGVLG